MYELILPLGLVALFGVLAGALHRYGQRRKVDPASNGRSQIQDYVIHRIVGEDFDVEWNWPTPERWSRRFGDRLE
jgi:hypothetical protein